MNTIFIEPNHTNVVSGTGLEFLPQDIQKYINRNVLFELNNEETRTKFESSFINLVCNDELNPPEIVEQHKLVFKYLDITYMVSS